MEKDIPVYYVEADDDGEVVSYSEPVTEEYSPGKFETRIFTDMEGTLYTRNPVVYETESTLLKNVPEQFTVNYSFVFPENICVRDPEFKINDYHLPVPKFWPMDKRKEVLSEFFPGVKFTTLTELKYY